VVCGVRLWLWVLVFFSSFWVVLFSWCGVVLVCLFFEPAQIFGRLEFTNRVCLPIWSVAIPVRGFFVLVKPIRCALKSLRFASPPAICLFSPPQNNDSAFSSRTPVKLRIAFPLDPFPHTLSFFPPRPIPSPRSAVASPDFLLSSSSCSATSLSSSGRFFARASPPFVLFA